MTEDTGEIIPELADWREAINADEARLPRLRWWIRAGAALVLLVVWIGAGTMLLPFDPNAIDLAQTSAAPDRVHLLGTDRLGRDVLSRLLAGGALSTGIALSAGLMACVVGVALGGVAGFGRRAGAVVDRAVDLAASIPMLFVAIALQAAVPPAVAGTIVVLVFAGWPAVTRIVRAEVAIVRTSQHVEAAYALGCSDRRILWRHVLPQCAGAVAAAFTVGFGEALLLQSTLAFLGLGLPPTSVTLGGMLQESTAELGGGAWWQVLLPGLAILGTTAAVGGLSRRWAAIVV